jgi:hypothetical protein
MSPGECLPPEILALLLENKLKEKERADALRHIAGCSECAMTYSIACDMYNEPIVKAKPVLFTLRHLLKAAAIVLLTGASFIGGSLYAHRVPFPSGDLESEYVRIVREFESSPLYWSRLDDSVRQGRSLAQSTRILGTRGVPDTPSVQEILTQKNDFDRRLNEIVSLSGQDVDTVLSVNGLDILAMTSSEIKIYAYFLRNDRVQKLQKAEMWLRFDQSAYFSLVERLPPEMWERYPVNDESLKTLSWIAELPQERKEKILALSPEDAKQERKTEETQNAS